MHGRRGRLLRMSKATFTPFSVAAGILAGLAARKILDLVWAQINEEEAPGPDRRDVGWGKLLFAAAIEGAVQRTVAASTDRGARLAYLRATGEWPE